MRIVLSRRLIFASILGALAGTADTKTGFTWRLLAAAEPTANAPQRLIAPGHATAPDSVLRLDIVQVRNEVHLPGQSSSTRVDDYSAILKDGWYHSADESFRLRVPMLKSGKINVIRRRWEKPDGIDVLFLDEDANWRAVFSFEADSKPAPEKLKKKYDQFLATQNTKYEANSIATRFGDTVEVLAMNWVGTLREYPYEPPSIDASKEKIAKIGPTVGIAWTFWRDETQCGLWMVMSIDRTLDEAAAFQIAKRHAKDFSDGLEFPEKGQTKGVSNQ